jgi:Mu-like prophage I protein
MIKHEGDQFCLYTKDGSRKIACHPTLRDAEAQEAAIRSRQAQNEALRGRAVLIALADIPITGTDSAEMLPNGDVLKWIPLADAGEKWVNGPQEFDMTPALIDQGISNWRKDGANPLVVTIGHTFDPAAPAAGWIENLERRSDGRPWGLVHFLADTWSRIEKGEFKYFSLEFYKQTVDRKGEDIGFAFDGGAILNKPFFAIRLDQEKHGGAAPCFALSRFTNDAPAPPSPEPAAPPAAAPPTALQQGDKPMSDPNPTPNPPAPAAPTVTGDKVTLSKAQFDSLIALQSENAQLKVKNEELKAKEASNDARITQLERKSSADRIRSAVKTLQRDHGVVLQLGDFAIDSSDADALAWLATQPYGVSTVEGLEKLARDTEATSHLPRVKLGGERSGGGNPDLRTPVDLSTKAGRLESIRRGVSQLRKETAKDELEFMLARRKQSPEAFVAEELANANPQFRKEILDEASSAA